MQCSQIAQPGIPTSLHRRLESRCSATHPISPWRLESSAVTDPMQGLDPSRSPGIAKKRPCRSRRPATPRSAVGRASSGTRDSDCCDSIHCSEAKRYGRSLLGFSPLTPSSICSLYIQWLNYSPTPSSRNIRYMTLSPPCQVNSFQKRRPSFSASLIEAPLSGQMTATTISKPSL